MESLTRQARHPRTLNNQRCIALRLSHGGTWSGYVLIGLNINWPSDLHCNDDSNGQYVGGGKNDN